MCVLAWTTRALERREDPPATAPAKEAPPSNDDDAAGERGRKELAELVRGALEAAEAPQPATLDDKERALGLELHAAKVEGVRALATRGEDEAKSVARMLSATRGFFAALTSAKAQFPYGCRVFLLETSAEKQSFLQKHPGVTAESRAWMEKLEGTGIPETGDWAFWEGGEERRLDGMVRYSIDWFFKSAYQLTLEKHAWLHEGLGFYLTHALVGTRMTWFFPPQTGDAKKNAKAAELAVRLREPDTDWLAEARAQFGPQAQFDIEELLHLEPSELGPAEYLRAHALAAYLVEVHRDALLGVVKRVGAGDDPRVVLEEACGMPLKDLQGRIATWLVNREQLIARAEGRRSEAELEALWEPLDAGQRKLAIELFEKRVAELDTAQLRTVRALVKGAKALEPQPAEYYDPKKHAPAQPIPRKRLAPTSAAVKKLQKDLFKEPDPRAAIQAFAYEWGSAKVVRIGDPAAPDTVFHNARLGLPPDADLARAIVLSRIDRPDERTLHAAFGHAYTDREGGVYPVTLYDVWCSGLTIEMPDVDALGVVHELLNEWKRWVAPVPGSQHEGLYAKIGDLFKDCRRSRELRETCADLLFAAQPAAREGYESQLLNLHSLWALEDSDPAKLAAALPHGKNWGEFLQTLVERCKKEPDLYSRGKARAAALRKDNDAIRSALGAALEEAALSAPSKQKPTKKKPSKG